MTTALQVAQPILEDITDELPAGKPTKDWIDEHLGKWMQNELAIGFERYWRAGYGLRVFTAKHKEEESAGDLMKAFMQEYAPGVSTATLYRYRKLAGKKLSFYEVKPATDTTPAIYLTLQDAYIKRGIVPADKGKKGKGKGKADDTDEVLDEGDGASSTSPKTEADKLADKIRNLPLKDQLLLIDRIANYYSPDVIEGLPKPTKEEIEPLLIALADKMKVRAKASSSGSSSSTMGGKSKRAKGGE
ncbi:hypothetical protein AYO44_13900 [Planctomycetaceae bacterium SCGC AG-212-F19]|nr:hypothetical protein AYO44_13900 [Planctomycetaceae bacterium SCGC AG-212-F19]